MGVAERIKHSDEELELMANQMEDSIFESDYDTKDPEPIITGIVHKCGAIKDIVNHYKQNTLIYLHKHMASRPKLDFVDPHYSVQKIRLTIAPFWDNLPEEMAFPHNNFIRQTLPDYDYHTLQDIGYHEDGSLKSGKIIFQEKVGMLGKSAGQPMISLYDNDFDFYINKLVSEVNGRPDGKYELRRVLEVKYFPAIAGWEYNRLAEQWEQQQSARQMGKVAKRKDRNFWTSTISDEELCDSLRKRGFETVEE